MMMMMMTTMTMTETSIAKANEWLRRAILGIVCSGINLQKATVLRVRTFCYISLYENPHPMVTKPDVPESVGGAFEMPKTLL